MNKRLIKALNNHTVQMIVTFVILSIVKRIINHVESLLPTE